jgi:general secretion pathway protein F
MGLYLYRALTQDGREVSGSLEYPEERAVLAWLESQGYIPLDIAPGHEGAGDPSASSGIPARELRKFSVIEFTLGLGMLLRAGLPIDKALASLAAASGDSGTRKLLQQVGREIREGCSLSKALRGFEKLFGRLYLSLIQAGEISGNLEVSIEHLSAYLESQQQLRERIVNAMIYPIILLFVTVFSIVLLMVVVMPKFKQLFEDMDAELPAVTQAFLSTSDFLRDYGSAICAVLLALAAAAFLLRGNAGFRALLDRVVLRLPWVGQLVKKVQVSRYAETLSMMLQCGIPIQRSLGASCQVVGNGWIRKQFDLAGKEIKEGGSFSGAIGSHFPALTRQIIKVGEQAGELEQSLATVSKIIRHDVDRTIQRVIGIFEPVIIIFLGAVVAGVIGSILVAVLGMNELVGG